MTNYSFDNNDPRLAAIRAQARAMLEADLQKTVTTKAGTFNIGRGVLQGNVKGFDITQVDPRKGISRADMFRYTGNVTRADPKVQQLIAGLEANKKLPNEDHIVPTFSMENESRLPSSAVQVRQATENSIPHSLAAPTIAHSEIASGVSVPSENLEQIGPAIPSNYASSDIISPDLQNSSDIYTSDSEVNNYEDSGQDNGYTDESNDGSDYFYSS